MDCKISSPHSVPHTIDRYVQFVWPVPEGQNDDSLVREAIPSNGTQSPSILCGKACSPVTRSLSATARGLLKCDITTRDFVIALRSGLFKRSRGPTDDPAKQGRKAAKTRRSTRGLSGQWARIPTSAWVRADDGASVGIMASHDSVDECKRNLSRTI
jgi:hypothetical protein